MDTEKQIAFNMWVLMVLEEINVWKVDKWIYCEKIGLIQLEKGTSKLGK